MAADETSDDQLRSYNPSCGEHVCHADLSSCCDNMWLSKKMFPADGRKFNPLTDR